MPSKVVVASTDPQTVFITPYDKIGKIMMIEIDNQATSAVTVVIQDVFTPMTTDETPNPTEQIVDRKVITVPAGAEYHYKTDGYIEILGHCQVVANVTATACRITICYEFE